MDKLSSAFIAWLVAQKAWGDADRRLAEASISTGLPPAQLAEEVAALKAKADALLAAVVKEELHMETRAPQAPPAGRDSTGL